MDDDDAAADDNWLPYRSDFLTGRCYDMAVALHRMTGLPLYGLFAEGDCHHAFVWDEDRKLGIDVRGTLRLKDLRKGCQGIDLHPVNPEDIAIWVGRPLAEDEIQEAVDFAERDEDLMCDLAPYLGGCSNRSRFAE